MLGLVLLLRNLVDRFKLARSNRCKIDLDDSSNLGIRAGPGAHSPIGETTSASLHPLAAKHST